MNDRRPHFIPAVEILIDKSANLAFNHYVNDICLSMVGKVELPQRWLANHIIFALLQLVSVEIIVFS